MVKAHILTITVVLIVACSARQVLFTPTEEELLARAQRALEEKRYSKAISVLEEFQVRFARSPKLPDALVLLGEAYMLNKEYILAENKFKSIIDRFPNSPSAEKSFYLLAKTYFLRSPRAELDQEFTVKAIETAEDFLSSYPQSSYADSARTIINDAKDKLAYKLLLNARLYYKMGDYDAALVYIDECMKNYPETKIIPEIRFLKAKIHIAKRQPEQAKLELERVLEGCSLEHKICKEAQKEILKLK